MQRALDGTPAAAASVNRIEGAPPPDRLGVPFGAYLLALGMGTLAFFAAVSVIILILMALPPLPLWIDPYFLILFAVSYLIVAVLLGFLWPTVSWRWGLWLSLPCVFTVILIHIAGISNETGLSATIISSLLIVTFPACACAFVGQRCAPSDLLIGDAREEFRETIPVEQTIASRAHYARDEGFGEIDKNEAAGNRKRDAAYIPTPVELLELFQQFQS